MQPLILTRRGFPLFSSRASLISTRSSFHPGYCFNLGELTEIFTFIFEYFDILVFNDGHPPPKIIILDQGAGIIAAWAKKNLAYHRARLAATKEEKKTAKKGTDEMWIIAADLERFGESDMCLHQDLDKSWCE